MSEKYYTVLEYAKLKGIDIDVTSACSHGRILTKMSKADGKTPVPVKDVDYGSVNSYPEYILDLYLQAGKLVKRMPEMPFGCYKGQPIDRVDIQYLQWFAENIDGHTALIETIKKYLETPEVAAKIQAAEEAKDKRRAKVEAKAMAMSSLRKFADFNEATLADMRTKTKWKEMGYKLMPGQYPSGQTQGCELYHRSQVEMTVALKQEEEERLKAIEVLDQIRSQQNDSFNDFVREIEEALNPETL